MALIIRDTPAQMGLALDGDAPGSERALASDELAIDRCDARRRRGASGFTG